MRDSIANILLKIKRQVSHIPIEGLYAVSIIFVGLTGFGLGFLSGTEASKGDVRTYYDPNLSTDPTIILEGQVVGSRKGTKYHYPWCPGAEQMSIANKRWFKTVRDARAAGYTPASNCEGLE